MVEEKNINGDKNSDAPIVQPPIPKIENIHAKVLAAVSQPNALDMKNWRSCDTTHSRAGWVVHLAGDAGYEFEKFYNTALAAQMIYHESSPNLPVSPVRFYESDSVAMADMKRMAELEAAEAKKIEERTAK